MCLSQLSKSIKQNSEHLLTLNLLLGVALIVSSPVHVVQVSAGVGRDRDLHLGVEAEAAAAD